MKTLLETMNTEALVRTLMALRLKLACRRHEAHFLRNISDQAKEPGSITGAVQECFPPRRKWQRPGRKVRLARPGQDFHRRALYCATMAGLARPDEQEWARNLSRLMDHVRTRAIAPGERTLLPPTVRVLPKTGKKKGQEVTKCRVVTVYEDLEDRLLMGMTAKYLMALMDPLLADCSHSGRATVRHSRSEAVRRIADYLAKRQGVPVYAAECDIRAFFDTVNHVVARRAFRRAVDVLGQQGIGMDPAAHAIMDQYLDGYDYFDYAEPRAIAYMQAKKWRGDLSCPDRGALPKMSGAETGADRIGIPQGGSLSPLLANLILDEADRAVLGDSADGDLLYLRYCDDMVILHTDEGKCRQALCRYTDAVKRLGFVVHEPRPVKRYGVQFFEEKSKLPYKVGDPRQDGKRACPWVNFLGYQVGRDGTMRVRKDSLDRHKQTLGDLAMRAIRLISHPRSKLVRDADSVLGSIVYRLVACGVGKDRLGTKGGSRGKYWLSAFELLKDSRLAVVQMRRLDQHRDRLVTQVMAALRFHHPAACKAEGGAKSGLKNGSDADQGVLKRPCIGRALSYCGSLIGDPPARLCRPRQDGGEYGTHF